MPSALPQSAMVEAGKEAPRLEADLQTARDLQRPPWLADVALPEFEITDERLPMRKQVDARFQRNEPRTAIRILYELIDKSSGDAQRFGKYYIKEGLMWAGEIPYSMLAYQHALPDPASHMQLGMCYLHYRQYEAALEQFRAAVELAPNSDTPTEMLRGQIYWNSGQLYQYADDLTTAAAAYERAEQSYREQANAPDFPDSFKNGQISRAEQMAEMIEFCRYAQGSGIGSLEPGRDNRAVSGTFAGSAQGYSGRIYVEVALDEGRIERVDVTRHRESNPLTAIELIPGRIVERQSLNVEWVPGAKYTSRAIVAAAFRAIERSASP